MNIKFKSTFCEQWRRAFGIVLWGDPPEVSKWKSLFLTGAVVVTIGIPFVTFYQAMPYQGQIPPETSYAKNFGKVIFENEKRGFKNYIVADFIRNDGRKFRLLGNSINLSEIKEWVDRNPDKDIYVEGFSLRNGSGLFWIAFASTKNGYVLVSREKRSRSLAIRREQFGPVMWWLYACFAAPLWLLSLNNIRKVRNSMDS